MTFSALDAALQPVDIPSWNDRDRSELPEPEDRSSKPTQVKVGPLSLPPSELSLRCLIMFLWKEVGWSSAPINSESESGL